MDSKITNDIPMIYETPQISGNNVKVSNISDSETNAASVEGTGTKTVNNSNNINSVNGNALKIPSAYDDQQRKLALETDLDNLIKQIMPDLGVRFKIHENTGQVITSVVNNDTKEVVREFPAEKVLDIIHNMCKKLGIYMNRKV